VSFQSDSSLLVKEAPFAYNFVYLPKWLLGFILSAM
jgi:hypothetical protein